MQDTLKVLEEQALGLPEDQRISLAHKIIQSTEPPGDSEIENWWEREIARRIDRLDSGETETHDASEVFRALDDRLRK
jgi:hypothetical protein